MLMINSLELQWWNKLKECDSKKISMRKW